MTLQQLKCFVYTARNLNFRKAAQQLFLSQPAVTRQVQSLEKELGVLLFRRVQNRISLTAAGQVLYEDALKILEQADFAEQHVKKSTFTEGVLRIGCESSVVIRKLPQILREFQTAYPKVLIHHMDISIRERRDMLLNSQLDAVFMPLEGVRETPGLSCRTIMKGSFCCIVPEGHALCQYEKITMDKLGNETFILLDAAHCPPEMDSVQQELFRCCPDALFYYSGSASNTIPMIEGGLGIAVMPDFVCPQNPSIRAIPLDGSHSIDCCVAWHSGEQLQYVRRFVQITSQAYAQA